MVDSGMDTPEPKQVVVNEADPALAGPGAARLPIMLLSIIFLLACVAGACCMALLQSGRKW
jgi:hypothetical protein